MANVKVELKTLVKVRNKVTMETLYACCCLSYMYFYFRIILSVLWNETSQLTGVKFRYMYLYWAY